MEQLFETDLIRMHLEDQLDKIRYYDTANRMQHPCYKSSVNSVIHEIIHRVVTTNKVKLDQVSELAVDFSDKKNGEVELSVIKQMIVDKLDMIEANRFTKSLEFSSRLLSFPKV